MADIPNRTDLEAELAKKLGRLFNEHRKELMTLLGDPPNITNIPWSFWQDIQQHLRQAITGLMTNIYLAQAEGLMNKLPIGVDWAIVNGRAASWAGQYVGQLITNITGTTQRAVQQIVEQYFRQGMTLGDLTEAMPRIFGPVRGGDDSDYRSHARGRSR